MQEGHYLHVSKDIIYNSIISVLWIVHWSPDDDKHVTETCCEIKIALYRTIHCLCDGRKKYNLKQKQTGCSDI